MQHCTLVHLQKVYSTLDLLIDEPDAMLEYGYKSSQTRALLAGKKGVGICK